MSAPDRDATPHRLLPDAAVFRELTADHLDAVAEIEARSSLLPWSRSLFAGELTMPASERHWLVATIDSVVVAFGGMMLIGDEAHLMNIAVDPAQRRSGIGRRLLSHLIVDVVEMGARHVTLEVRTDNLAARRLYADFGFESAGERKDYYGHGEHASILWARHIDTPDYLAGIRRAAIARAEIGPVGERRSLDLEETS